MSGVICAECMTKICVHASRLNITLCARALTILIDSKLNAHLKTPVNKSIEQNAFILTFWIYAFASSMHLCMCRGDFWSFQNSVDLLIFDTLKQRSNIFERMSTTRFPNLDWNEIFFLRKVLIKIHSSSKWSEWKSILVQLIWKAHESWMMDANHHCNKRSHTKAG